MNISSIAMANNSDMKQTNVHINDENDVFFPSYLPLYSMTKKLITFCVEYISCKYMLVSSQLMVADDL